MKYLTLAQIASDERLPRAAIGYIADLQDDNISVEVKKDRIERIRRYIPEFIFVM